MLVHRYHTVLCLIYPSKLFSTNKNLRLCRLSKCLGIHCVYICIYSVRFHSSKLWNFSSGWHYFIHIICHVIDQSIMAFQNMYQYPVHRSLGCRENSVLFNSHVEKIYWIVRRRKKLPSVNKIPIYWLFRRWIFSLW